MRHVTRPRFGDAIKKNGSVGFAGPENIGFTQAELALVRSDAGELHALEGNIGPQFERSRTAAAAPMTVRAVHMEIRAGVPLEI